MQPKPNHYMANPELDVIVQPDALRELAAALYEAVGVPEDDARLVADLQVTIDLRGVHSHGTRALPGYVRRIQSGQINPTPNIRVVREGISFVRLDGDSALGHVACHRAMTLAIEKAKETGMASAAVFNSNHFGAAANYAMMALEHDMIGFAASSSSPGLAPFGGKSRVLGNHPFSYAIPTNEEPPIVLDMACGVSAWGRIGTIRMYGGALTEGWALDADGNPTIDPAKAAVMLPFGGVKGYGLTIIMDALTGPLSGSVATVNRIGDAFGGQKQASQFFYAIYVDAFADVNEFKAEIDRQIRTIRDAPKTEGVSSIYLPGEIEWKKMKRWQSEGIPLHRDHIASLMSLAKELGVDVSISPNLR